MCANISQMPKRGPNTPAGKARSSRNAVKHGMLSTSPVIEELEDPDEWERHLRGMTEAFEPVGYLEEVLVGRIALLTWRLRRIIPYERDMTVVDHSFHYQSAASVQS